MKSPFKVLFLLGMAYAALCGCASQPVNAPLQHVDESTGYRLDTLALGEKNSNEMFVILGLSGGGTRAVALDYGVMSYLARIRFGADHRSLLDELDMVSSSSAASLTAAYYGLYGPSRFLADFKDDVLYQKLESVYLRNIFNPFQWPRLASGDFARSDLLAEYFDKHVFEGRTFADMQPRRPFIMMNATDMGAGAQFSFVQGYFDLICSDLSPLPVAMAVTASLAYTPFFTPFTLKNYNDGRCGFKTPGWAERALRNGAEADPLLYAAAESLLSYEAIDKRPYIHLLDSGVSDNVSIRSPQLAFRVSSLLDQLEDGSIRKLVIILVDARIKPWFKGDLKAKPPGMVTSVSSVVSNVLENYSYETVNLLKRNVSEISAAWEDRQRIINTCFELADSLCASEAQNPDCKAAVSGSCLEKFEVAGDRPEPLEVYLVHVNFEQIEDPDRRAFFQSIPTSLQLPRDDIGRLIEVAPELINGDTAFQRLFRDLNARVSD